MCVSIQPIKYPPPKKKITIFVPNDDCLNFIDEYVLFAVFGHIGDISVVCFKVVKVATVSWLYTKARRKEQDHKF